MRLLLLPALALGLLTLPAIPLSAQELAQQCVDAGITTTEDCDAYLQSLSAPQEEAAPPEEAAPLEEAQPQEEAPPPEEAQPEAPPPDEQTYDQPAAEEPVYDQPAPEEPAAQEPAPEPEPQAEEAPVYDTPVDSDGSIDQAPAQDEQPAVEDTPEAQQPDLPEACLDAGYTTQAECDNFLQQQAVPAEEAQPAQPSADEQDQSQPDADQQDSGGDDTATGQDDASQPAELSQDCLDRGATTQEECDANSQANPDAAPAEDSDQTATPEESGDAPDAANPDATGTDADNPAVTTPDANGTESTDTDSPDATAPDANSTDADNPDTTTPDGTTPDDATPDDTADAPEGLLPQAETNLYSSDEPVAIDSATEPVAGEDPSTAAALTDSGKEDGDVSTTASEDAVEAEPVPASLEDAMVETTETQSDVVAQSRAASADATPLEQAPNYTQNITNITNTTTTNVTNITNVTEVNNTYVYEENGVYAVNNFADDRNRIFGNDDNYRFDQVGDNRFQETVYRADGSALVTVRDQYGNILERYRTNPDGSSYVFAYFDPRYYDDMQYWNDPGDELPPLHLRIAPRDYVLDWSYADEDDLYRFFSKPPVERARRVYSIDEVKRSARLRDTISRVELGNLNFASGSSRLSRNQINALAKVAQAMLQLIRKNPGETFLIEGHTDAPGSDRNNLVLSDQRASSVARILTHYYRIPPENLATQGYGERFLKVRTQVAEPTNRRVTVRRITALVAPNFARR